VSATLALGAPTTAAPKDPARAKRPALLALLALLLASAFLSVGLGAFSISPGQVLGILAHQVGIDAFTSFEPRHENVLIGIRLPRALLAIVVGAGLALAGAALQGLFRNPLADPGLVGVSSGAALSAAATIVLGGGVIAALPHAFGLFALPVAAFLGSLATTFLIWRIARSGGRVQVATLLLAGIAINALSGSGTGLLTLVASDPQLRSLTFWSMGSLNGASWSLLLSVLPFVGVAAVGLPRLARSLNALLLGESEAGHLGVRIERVKRQVVILAALAVGASVAVSGMIGFIGLVAPHLARLLLGPDHRSLLPGSALLGGLLLSLSDLVARTAIAPAEIPVGILTSLLGAPFFLWLLLRPAGARS